LKEGVVSGGSNVVGRCEKREQLVGPELVDEESPSNRAEGRACRFLWGGKEHAVERGLSLKVRGDGKRSH